MSIPTPSFFKIRLVLLIISFFLFCFLIGFVKNSFGAYPGECTAIYYLIYGSTISVTGRDKSYSSWQINDSGQVSLTGTYDYVDPGTKMYSVKIVSFYWEDGVQKYVNIITRSRVTTFGPGIKLDTWDVPDDCHISCKNEIEELTNQCGGIENEAWKWTDEDNCIGQCIVPCQAEIDALTEKCGGVLGTTWEWTDQDTCKGECTGCDKIERLKQLNACPASIWFHWDDATCTGVCGPIGDCTPNQIATAKNNCGGKGVKFTKTVGGCEYECEKNCSSVYVEARYTCGEYGIALFNWDNCDYACDKCPQKKHICADRCKTKGGVRAFDCTMSYTGQAVSTCQCETDAPPIPDPVIPDPEKTPDKPADPQAPDNPKKPDPENAPEDPWGKAIKDATDRVGDIANGILDDNRKQTGLLGWIGDSLGTINDNIGGVYDYLGKLLHSGNEIENGLNGIEGELEEINRGRYQGPRTKEPYIVPENDFSIRTTTFLSEMKSTGIFSIPSQLASSIPGGGSPILSIETGKTFGGTHTIDFSMLSTALLILRSLFQISGMAIAIRIVTLKR
jgi:hypothetical protein